MDDPVERQTWPSTLTARVVAGGPEPRVLGYRVDDDLAPNYSFAETLFLLTTGRLPEDDAGRAFEIALLFTLPISAGDAATHAASLARMCGARPKNVIAISAAGVAERAAERVDDALLRWLADGGAPPPSALASTPDVRTAALLRTLPSRFAALPAFAHSLHVDAAVIAVLHECGVRTPESIVLALTVAGLGATSAEALATPLLDFRNYPMQLPLFDYAEPNE